MRWAIAGQFPGPNSITWTDVTGFVGGGAPVIEAGRVSTEVKTFEYPLLGLTPVFAINKMKCLKSIFEIGGAFGFLELSGHRAAHASCVRMATYCSAAAGVRGKWMT